MGGGFSVQKFPPIITRDPLPSSGAFVGGISKGGRTQECGLCSNPRDKRTCRPCRLVIAQGVSASGAKLYREYGSISVRECNKFAEDSAKVNANEMAFDEFKANLLDGKYYAKQENGYCSQLLAAAEDLTNAKSPNDIDWNKVRRPRIRKMTVGGGYSSSTKLYIKPAIPFQFKFNNETVQVSVMTLFHPSPIRVENVQHDAMLTLGDPADASGNTVLLIPLAASNKAGTSGTFFSRIVSYMPGILQPNPASGQYDSIDAPTGKDWNLSMLFPGTPSQGETVVASPYYAWFSVPEMEEFLKETVTSPSPWPDKYHYSWRQKPGTNHRFVMLAEPIPINTFDMQTIRMLPATPAEEALPFIFEDSVVYAAALPVRRADGTVSACPQAPTPTSSIATPPSQRETFENKECDPFGQITPQERLSPSTLMTIIGSVIGAIAIFVGVYFALKYATDNNWGPKLMQWGRAAGKAIASGPGPGGKPPSSSGGPEEGTKKNQEAEIARTKAEDEAEAKAKAEAEAKQKAEDEEVAENERRTAEIRAKQRAEAARRANMTPLEKANARRAKALEERLDAEGDVRDMAGNLDRLQNSYDQMVKSSDEDGIANAKRNLDEFKESVRKRQADADDAKRREAEAEAEIERLTKEAAAAPKRRTIAAEEDTGLTATQAEQLATLKSKLQKLDNVSLAKVSPARRKSIELQMKVLRKGISDIENDPTKFAEIAGAMKKEIVAIEAAEKAETDKVLQNAAEQVAAIKARQADADKRVVGIVSRGKELSKAAGTGLVSEDQLRENDARMERELKALEDKTKRDQAAANALLKQGKQFQDASMESQANRLIRETKDLQTEARQEVAKQSAKNRIAMAKASGQSYPANKAPKSAVLRGELGKNLAGLEGQIGRKGGKKTRRHKQKRRQR